MAGTRFLGHGLRKCPAGFHVPERMVLDNLGMPQPRGQWAFSSVMIYEVNGSMQTWQRLFCSWNHNCVVRYSEVVCWGSNSSCPSGGDYSDVIYGQPSQSSLHTFNVGVLRNPISISAGGNYSCVDNEGLVACVGDDSRQQLGRNQSVLSNSQYPNIVLSDEFESILVADDLTPGTMSSSTQSTCYTKLITIRKLPYVKRSRSVFASSNMNRQRVEFPEFGSDSISVHTTEGLVCTVDANQTSSCIGNVWRRDNNRNLMVFEDEERNTSLPGGITKLAVGRQTICGLLQNGTIVCEGRYHGSNLIGIQNTFSYPAYLKISLSMEKQLTLQFGIRLFLSLAVLLWGL